MFIKVIISLYEITKVFRNYFMPMYSRYKCLVWQWTFTSSKSSLWNSL